MDESVARLFHLEHGHAHLNHGSFGAVPIAVLQAQAAAMRRAESNPERFYRDDMRELLRQAREAARQLLGTDSISLVANVTEAAVVVLNAVGLRPGDEVVMSNHAYPWVRASTKRAVEEAGATIVEVTLPSPDAAPQLFGAAITPRTRLVVVDQIASESAWVLPVDQVIAAVPPELPVFVDGAHAPGLIEHPVPAGAAFWAGNFHKWAFSARTVGGLWAARSWRDRVRPLVKSADWDRPVGGRFDHLGTIDQSARISLPAAVSFPVDHLGMTFDELRVRNHRLLLDSIALLDARVGAVPASPDWGLPLRVVDIPSVAVGEHDILAFVAQLRARGASVAGFSHDGHLRIRLSVQCYNDLADFDLLAAALAS